jgi:hypothetical protein
MCPGMKPGSSPPSLKSFDSQRGVDDLRTQSFAPGSVAPFLGALCLGVGWLL